MVIFLLVQYSHCNQRIIHVSELSSDNTFSTGGENGSICCVYGNCTCNSLHHALANLTSNVLINITTDVTLSSLVKLSNLENVSIIGHRNNPTLNCKSVGGIHFTFCHNYIIRGITWNECGTENINNYVEPGLVLSLSTNITINNCFFQYSKGQAVLLSAVSGNVNISHCSFVHNSQYRGHGAAIHYSSSNLTNCHQVSFAISDCNFMHNKHAESLVYIENRIPHCNNYIILYSSKFCHNQGSSVYAINQTIYLSDNNLFHNITGKNGTGIYIRDYSTIKFSENSEMTFFQNFANHNGILYLSNHSNVIFDQNSVATFNSNQATNGIVYSEINSNIIFQANCKVTFHNNTARCYGAAVYSSDNSHIVFTGNSTVTFNSNVVSTNYISVYEDCGGTIYSTGKSYISFKGNSTTLFTSNRADYGGAIFTEGNCYILFEGNSTTLFTSNTGDHGGAIYSKNSIRFKENSSVLFDNNTAGSYGGAICSDSYAFGYLIFAGTSAVVFSNNYAGSHGGAVYTDLRIGYLSFEEKSTTAFSNNSAYRGGAIYASDHENLFFKANSTTEFSNNTAISGGALYCILAIISFEGFSVTVFSNNTGGATISTVVYSNVVFSDNSTVTFNNNAKFGAIIYSNQVMAIGNSTVIFNNHMVKWCNNTCLPYHGFGREDITIDSDGVVRCGNPRAFICSSKNCYCKHLEDLLDGLTSNSLVNITDNVTLSSVIELRNLNNISIIGYNNITVTCDIDGGGLYVYSCNQIIVEGVTWIGCGNGDIDNTNDHISVIKYFWSFGIAIQNCTFQYSKGPVISLSHIKSVNINYCNFMNNNHYKEDGSAIQCVHCNYWSMATINITNCNFTSNGDAESILYFRFSSRNYPTHIYLSNSNYQNNKGKPFLLFDNFVLHISGVILFDSNVAEYGAGIYIHFNSIIIFDKNSNVNFVNNHAFHSGAAIYLGSYSSVTFEQSSTVTFNNNKASSGTIYSTRSYVIFKETCQVTFKSNSATQRGSAISSYNSHIIFTGNSEVTFSNNIVSSNDKDLWCHGGTIFSGTNGYITFEENTSVDFNNNIANFGAAIHSFRFCSITFMGKAKVAFRNNTAEYCGVLTSVLSSIIFNDNIEVTFNSNTVSYTLTNSPAAAAICTALQTDVMFAGYSLVKFANNRGGGGGATVFSESNVVIEGYSTVIFNNNIAQYSFGAALTCYDNTYATFRGNSNISFISNEGSQDGGAVYSYSMCKIATTDNSTLIFLNNTARNNGGAIFANDQSSITLTGNSVLLFINNKASHGGAVCINEKTKLMFKENSTTVFNKSSAVGSGGALKVLGNSKITLNNHVNVQLNDNSADYGGAIFLDTTAVMVNSSNNVKFTNNIAKILGSSVYLDIPELCNIACINDKVVGISKELIATPPNELKFYDPAICIDDDNDTQCNSYYVQNIMLGREIDIRACVLDYYSQPIDSAQFLIHSEMNPRYFISGPKHVVISCDTFKGITVMANQRLLESETFSLSIALNTALYSGWKQITVNLTIELSLCHPGFWQYPKSEKCECYSTIKDVVFCSGNSSTIKRGYWFGNVTEKPTVTVCPIHYCNFTCCESSNGYYHLSPVRDNQCRSHRSGTACGSCSDGYTLSFDSTECVSIKNCTAGHTILVILLSITYWIVMVTSVFAIMYYKVGIGYLYGITYYYSVVDILLSQNLHVNRGLYLTVSMMSSFSKITPQFLGDLCFTTEMSGIDQQFIHYMHPLAVILILGIISLSARMSQKISVFISRRIIHVICLLILLSYTSIASTSLMLMRPLTFHDIDKVYTYLSPDIEYFHGRHSAYGIVALLCIISIVAGLPLLLTLEPFLNRKFNFTKIKPLLDQFQGCYKDKYRCFAGYYMICRLLIITIVIAKSADDFVANYILIVVCGITEFIHVMVKPYNKELLNKLDIIILALIIFIMVLSLSDDFDSPFVITIAVMLVILPLLILIAITLFLHKHNLRKMIERIEQFALKDKSPSNNDVSKNEMPVREFDLVVDDSMRENNTIFDA